MANASENTIGSMLTGVNKFSTTVVQERLFNERISNALADITVAAERSGQADSLMIKQLASRFGDPALQNTLRSSFADFQSQISQTLSNAQSTVSNANTMKTFLKGLGRLAGPAGLALTAAQIDTAVDSGDSQQIGEALTGAMMGALAGFVGAALGAALSASALAPVIGAGVLAALGLELLDLVMPDTWNQWIGEREQELQGKLTDFFEFIDLNGIVEDVSGFFTSGQSWVQRRDPLTLDLDGDGLEVLANGGANGVLFDHDADGVKTSTSWISPDDGFLVRDRNGNGLR